MKFKFLAVFFVVLLGGCADSYTCSQYPESGCQPVSTVYERTNDGFNDYRNTLFDEENDNSENGEINIQIGKAHRAINYANPGDAILSKPVVMRVFINSWVDKEKDLNSGGFIYLRLRESEWLINK